MRNGNAREEVCIIVGKNWKKYVTEWKEVSSRLMYVRMKIGESKYVIVGAYGPGSEKKKEERESFCTIWVSSLVVLRTMR